MLLNLSEQYESITEPGLQFLSGMKSISMLSLPGSSMTQMDVAPETSWIKLLRRSENGTICLPMSLLFESAPPITLAESLRRRFRRAFLRSSSARLMSFLRLPIAGSGEIIGRSMGEIGRAHV